MKKSEAIKIIDLFSFISLVFIISTGAFLKFTLPPRSGGSSVWNLTRHEWGDIHFYISLFFLVLMSIHLILHFSFIKKAIIGKATREQNYRLFIGMVSIIILILFSLAPFFSPVDNSNEPGHGKHLHSHNQPMPNKALNSDRFYNAPFCGHASLYFSTKHHAIKLAG